jgi:hypothetical protein
LLFSPDFHVGYTVQLRTEGEEEAVIDEVMKSIQKGEEELQRSVENERRRRFF